MSVSHSAGPAKRLIYFWPLFFVLTAFNFAAALAAWGMYIMPGTSGGDLEEPVQNLLFWVAPVGVMSGTILSPLAFVGRLAGKWRDGRCLLLAALPIAITAIGVCLWAVI